MGKALLKSFTVVILMLLATKASSTAGSLTLFWDPSSGDVAGYLLHYGTSSNDYTDQISTQATTATAANLTDGVTYYFVATAYNANGVESLPSNEVSGVPDSTPTPTPTSTPTPTPEPSATPFARSLLNISTRVHVRNGADALIGGFIIAGDANKSIVIRALGPSLTALGVPNVLADPVVDLYDSSGQVIASNDNWTSLPPGTVPADLQPSDPAEAVIATSLAPGGYTAIVRGVNNTDGNALCELYDLEPASSTVLNISTRGLVGSADDVMIGGFIVGGTEASKVIIRAIGPSLVAEGVPGALPDPILELHSSDGSLIFQNDNWRSDQEQQIIDTTIPPTDDRESAIVATLTPGAYTAIVRGANGTTGVALVEVYALNP